MTSIFTHIYAAEEEREEEERHRNQMRRRHISSRPSQRGKRLTEARLTKTGMSMKEVTSGYKNADRAFLVKNADVFKVGLHESMRDRYRLMRKKFHDASKLVRTFVVILLIYVAFFVVMVIWMFIQMVVEHETWDYFVGYMTMGACMWVFGLGALYVAMRV